MKVKNINSNSKKSTDRIKKSFIKLLCEKKEISQITVTELVKDADLTRSAFYTHYDSLYDVAKDIQDETISNFLVENIEFHNFQDVSDYIDSTIVLLKQNEDMYRMLASSYDIIFYFDRIRNSFVDKMYKLLIKSGKVKNDNLKLDVEFFIDGMLYQIIKYFRTKDSTYSLELIGEKVKVWLKELFL